MQAHQICTVSIRYNYFFAYNIMLPLLFYAFFYDQPLLQHPHNYLSFCILPQQTDITVILCYNVYLSISASVILFKNYISIIFKICGCDLLIFIPDFSFVQILFPYPLPSIFALSLSTSFTKTRISATTS